jgi:hypothetical protein
MNENIKDIEENLKEFCINIIELLDRLREDGLIEEDEYQKQIYKKKEFLNNIL